MNCFLRVVVPIISLALFDSYVFVRAQVNEAQENPAKTTVGQQTDLSGTYEGTVNYPDGGLRTDVILIIAKDKLRLLPVASESVSANEIQGSIITNTTANYRAAVLALGDPSRPTIISVHAILKNGELSLTSAAGETRAFSFTGHLRRKPKLREGEKAGFLIPEGERVKPASPAKVEAPRPQRKRRKKSGRP